MKTSPPFQHPLVYPDILVGLEEGRKLGLDVGQDWSDFVQIVFLHLCINHHVWILELEEPPDDLEPVPAHHTAEVRRGNHLVS